MIKTVKMRHVGIVVNDMEKSLHFYRDILGLNIFADNIEKGSFIDTILGLVETEIRTVKMGVAPDVTLVELLDFRSHRERKSMKMEIYNPGPRHIALEVENIHSAYILMLKDGIKFISPPVISPDGKAKVAFCYAPEGMPVELVEILKR